MMNGRFILSDVFLLFWLVKKGPRYFLKALNVKIFQSFLKNKCVWYKIKQMFWLSF